MNHITFISTIHEENGKCNADELCVIFEKISPDVVFLEAIESTYSHYQKNTFSSFGVYHRKLEIKAIQKYSQSFPIEYVPVLERGLPEIFYNKYNQVCENLQFQKMLNDYNLLASEHGFNFLNSTKSIELQEKMRLFEKQLLNNNELSKAVDEDIEAYENTMVKNIYIFCQNNQFEKAIFMCGVAHRYSIIKKIESFNSTEKVDLHWEVYGN